MPAYGLSDAAARTIGRALRYYRDYEDAQDRADSTERLSELIAALDPDPPTAGDLVDALRQLYAAVDSRDSPQATRAMDRARDVLRRWDAAQ